MSSSEVTLDYSKAKPISPEKSQSWVGVDLDGSLAKYSGWKGKTHIGAPIPMMVDRVKRMLANGEDVRIFTARVANDPDGSAKKAIEDWTEKYIGQRLAVTHIKDEHLRAIYDDRAVQLERNTGQVLGSQRKAKAETTEKVKAQETKYKYGNTQADIPANSEAGKALAAAREKIDKADLMDSSNTTDGGGLEEESHITVRYGIDSGDTGGIRAFLEKQAPFEAMLGKVTSFPPSEHSDGAAPIVVAIESPALRKLEKELDKHGSFIERTFPEYKPHATLGYVKPGAAKKYVGIGGMEGKKFTVRSVSISKKDGSKEEVRLKGTGKPSFYKPKNG